MMRTASTIIFAALLITGCQANRSFRSELAGAWTYTDARQFYSKTYEGACIREDNYDKYAMIADGEQAAEQPAIIIREDGSFDLSRTVYAMLGSGIEGLRHVGDEMMVHGTDGSVTGRVRVDQSEFTAKRSVMGLHFDVEYVNCKDVLLEAELKLGGVALFRYVERYVPVADRVIENGVIAKLRRFKGKDPY